MKLQTKKQLLRGVLLCVGIIIIALSLFYLYNYLDNKHNKYNINEGFKNYNDGDDSIDASYQPYNYGEPLGPPLLVLSSLVSSTYTNPNINDIFSNITSNSKTIYALDNFFQMYYYDNTTSTWKSPQNVSLSIPTPTNPSYADYTVATCRPDNILLVASDTTLWYYNHGRNNINHVGCIYYINLNSDGSIPNNRKFTCLKLPILSSANILPTRAGETKPSISFDNITLLAANKSFLFATGCTGNNNNINNLYYLSLNNGIPPSTGIVWSSIANLDKISHISINDYCLFIYYSNGNIINYIPLTYDSNGDFTGQINTWTRFTDAESPLFYTNPSSPPSTNPNGFSNFTVNNDVCWAINFNATKLWWCALLNGVPSDTISWNSYNCTDSSNRSLISPLIDFTLYNNNLIIFTSSINTDNKFNNFIIPLYYSESSSFTSTTSPNPTGTGTTSPNPTGPGTRTTSPNPTGTGTRTTSPNPTGTGTTYPNTTQQYNPEQSLLSEIDLKLFFNSGTSNSSSNLYISPMNNSDLYNPTKANRISSSFFPMVKIN